MSGLDDSQVPKSRPKFALVFLVSILVIAAVKYREWFGGQKTDWTTYSSADDKCEIKFPGPFTTSEGNGMRKAGLNAPNGNGIYMFAIKTLPIDIGNEKAVKAILDAGVPSVIETLKGSKLLKQSDVTISGFPGRDFEVEMPNGDVFRGRTILTPERQYQVNIAGPKTFVGSENANQFRGSFKTTQQAMP